MSAFGDGRRGESVPKLPLPKPSGGGGAESEGRGGATPAQGGAASLGLGPPARGKAKPTSLGRETPPRLPPAATEARLPPPRDPRALDSALLHNMLSELAQTRELSRPDDLAVGLARDPFLTGALGPEPGAASSGRPTEGPPSARFMPSDRSLFEAPRSRDEQVAGPRAGDRAPETSGALAAEMASSTCTRFIGGAAQTGEVKLFRACSNDGAHRWNRNPRPQPQKSSKQAFLIYFSQSCIFLNWLSGALVGGRGFRPHVLQDSY